MPRFRLIAIILWSVAMAVLAVSTFCLSTPIYDKWWFVTLWALIAAMLCASIVGMRMWRRMPLLILHASFIFMLAGGLCSWLMGKSGTIILAPGETTQVYLTKDGTLYPLPCSVALEDFTTKYFPGTVAPREYVSRLLIDGNALDLAVNHPVDLGALRLYQSSFLSDGSSVIGVTDDRWGKNLSFAGYLFFAIGGLLTLVSRKGKFRSILRSLGIVAALFSAPHSYAANVDQQVLYNGRVAHISTPATDLLLKVSGQRTLGGYHAEDAMLSMLAYPEKWREQRFILVKNSALRDSLGLAGKYASIDDLFDAVGNYRLINWYIPGGKSRFDKALLQVDEKVELLLKLHSGEFFSPLPDDMPRLPQWKADLECLYNRLPFAKIYFMAALAIGIVMLLASVLKMRFRGIRIGAMILVCMLLAWQLAGYVLRWIVYGRIPLGNTGETLVFVSIALLALGLLIGRKDALVLPISVILSGFAGLVANLSQSDPIVTPLMPVLSSPWLGIHVTLVMSAYSILAFSCIVSAIGMKSERGRKLSLAMLYPAVYLLGLGIFTGAIWAEVAWGRYWAWDPKETWALITFMAYAVPLHSSIKWLRAPVHFNAYVLVASLTMLMTYFGVNYLGGLHAYG